MDKMEKKQEVRKTGADRKKGRGQGLDILAYAMLAASFLLLVFLNIFYLDHWLDSDMAAEMIFSRLLADRGEFLASSGWYYSTEFRVLYTQIFMQPLFYLFQSWHVVRLITNLLSYALLLCSYFYMCGPLKVKRRYVVFTSAILLLPFSETVALHVQMGNTYMPHMILLFFLFGIFLRLSEWKRESGLKKLPLAGCYLLLCVVCGLSGVRYFLALQAPLVAAAVVCLMKSADFPSVRKDPNASQWKKVFSGERLGYAVVSLAGAGAAFAGYLLNVTVIASKYEFQTYEATNFISVYQGIFMERLQNTLGSLLMLFGYIPDKGFLSLRGLVTLTAFVLLTGIVIMTVRCGRLLRAEGECRREVSHRKFLLWFAVTAFVLNTFVFVFTTSTIVPRYYITVFQFALPLLAVYFEEERLPLDRFLLTAALCGCMGLAVAKTSFSLISTDKNMDKRRAAEFLSREDYRFGYATYWNANIFTELTDGKVEVANIRDLAEMDYFYWSSPKKYYEEGYSEGKTFLLLTREEAEEYPGLTAGGNAGKVYEDEYYVVLHFDSAEEFQRLRGTVKAGQEELLR